MNDFLINLFIPRNYEGSSLAVAAHVYAHLQGGAVSIVRCESDEEANTKIQQLLHHITMADGYDAPQPEHREIWIFGFTPNLMVTDELGWFSRRTPGRSAYFIKPAANLSLSVQAIMLAHNLACPNSLWQYLQRVMEQESGYRYVYRMLDEEEYEHLIAYLLRLHPNAQDVTKEDYVLNLFVEHEKQRIHSYV